MLRLRHMPRKIAVALLLAVVLFSVLGAIHRPGSAAAPAASSGPVAVRTLSASVAAQAPGKPIAARTLADTAATGGLCSVPGIGDIGGLFGFCSLGSSGITGDLNNLCQPGVPEPEPANSGLNALIKPPATAGKPLATPYAEYGMSGQFWAATNLQCSDMTSLIGNDVAGMLFDFAKAMDRVTITVYQSAAGEGILAWLQNVADKLISGLGNAIYFPYLSIVVIIAAIWLAWQGLIRKRGTRTIEGTIWIVVAAAAAIWLIGRPADFTGVGKGVSDGISTALNTAFAHLPSPGQASCLPVGPHDPQISTASYSYTSGGTVVDQNANELWTVLVCKPWLDGEFGTTAFAAPGAKATVVNSYGRALLWAQGIAANENPTAALIKAKQAAYAGIASTIQQQDPGIYPLFQGKQWTTRLEIAFAALLAAVVAGVLVLLISVTLILLKLGFLLLLIVGPFFLLVGTHPGFGRVVAVRWVEMLVGVLLKQAAVALALSVLLYCYALIMGTADAVLPWALKILMITLVTVAVFIYRKPFQHLFTAVGYGAIGSTDRAEADLSRAAASARANTRTAATIGVPGFAAYRAARWARRNPAQAAGLALGATSAVGTAALATGGADSGGLDGSDRAAAGMPDGGGQQDQVTAGGQAGSSARARAWRGSAGTASASEAPPLRLPARQGTAASWPQNGSSASVQAPGTSVGSGSASSGPGPASGPPPRAGRPAASGGYPVVPAQGGASGASSSAGPAPRRTGGSSAPSAWSNGGSSTAAPRPAAPPIQPPRQAPAEPRPASQARPIRPSGQASPARQATPSRSGQPGRPASNGSPWSGSGGSPGGGSAAGGSAAGGSAGGGSGGPAGLSPLAGQHGSQSPSAGGPAGGSGGQENGPFWSRPFWRRK
jgi:hypothetical protein